ncbi:protein ZINC INDUCED FACILITATOR-LIKE 1-like isoform X2 [Asparagus officinalis]|uniref:protein ZINC INDUCED FACILITATOR-LIKE 1-like isoform X2 n=1 Tax=Asparagus officinalis TaxID=4686 RepID=UPI00098E5D36|nr:protein ZINC INDUCED FACILITATOR-LIKE 1-like isoform X2 [Asparagus officinalis]
MGDESKVPLLEKVYFENCPGCRIDKKKDESSGLPYKEFFFVWITTLATGLPISSLFPFLYFMIRDLQIAKRVEDIGFYAGFVGAAFMFGRALTSVFWGILADRWGRKPVIIIGLISLIIFNTLFGLSVNYWMAIATRFLLGAMNGLLGPIKAYASEVCRPEHQSIGLSLVSTAWGIGLIIGPALGGFFAQPAEKFPGIISEESFLGRFPYFLPCFCISLFAVGVLIACYWLPETLHNHPESKTTDETIEPLEASYNGSDMREKDVEDEGRAQSNKENLLTNWPLMSSIIVYCVFSLHDMAYSEIFSLWAESDRKFGGLSFSSEDVGEVLAISGFSLLVFQLFLYPPAERLLGPINLSRVSAAISIPLLASHPFMTNLSGLVLSVAVNCASLLKNVLSMIIITGTFILQNNAVAQHQRGAANGISMTAMSFFKAIAPAAAGVIFSWAQKRQDASFLPGDQMVFFILILVEFIGLMMTFKPFLAVKN